MALSASASTRSNRTKGGLVSVTEVGVSLQSKEPRTRFGYAVAVSINLVMLIVVHQVLDWGWPTFLTDNFDLVVPWISLSLIITITANLVYQFNDAPTVKSTGQILVNLIGISVTYRIYQVFPFDFSATSFNWETVVRVLLILAMVGAGIGVLTEAGNLASNELRDERR